MTDGGLWKPHIHHARKGKTSRSHFGNISRWQLQSNFGVIIAIFAIRNEGKTPYTRDRACISLGCLCWRRDIEGVTFAYLYLTAVEMRGGINFIEAVDIRESRARPRVFLQNLSVDVVVHGDVDRLRRSRRSASVDGINFGGGGCRGRGIGPFERCWLMEIIELVTIPKCRYVPSRGRGSSLPPNRIHPL